MEALPLKRPRAALTSLWATLIQEDIGEFAEIELVFRISDRNLIVRDLGAFCEFIDHIYGRLSSEGLDSYSRRSNQHLEISKVTQGSWELVIEGIISRDHHHAELLVIIWLAVKYLPPAVNSLAAAYNQYEQGRLSRQQRKLIRHGIDSDELLKSLQRNRKNEIAKFLATIYEKEHRKLARVANFINKGLIEVLIRAKDRKN